MKGSPMDIYRALGVEPIINAGGTLTRLSGSVMHPEVVDAMAAASRKFVDMPELHAAAGQRVADLIGVEAAHVCACATAGIAIMAAAVMAGTDRQRVRQLPDTVGMANRFVTLKSHRNPFDQALRISGGVFVEVDPEPDAIAAALREEGVAGLFYTFSWFNTGEAPDLPAIIALAHAADVPVIVDAAAEVPPLSHLQLFVEQGADLVTFSGGKAICGPQASGFILGRADLVAACAANDSPNMSVARGMKAGKEEICGLVKAVELYVERDHEADQAVWEGRVVRILSALDGLVGIKAWRQLPFGLGQQIPHVALRWRTEDLDGHSCQDVAAALKAGSPRIACQVIEGSVYTFARDLDVELRFHVHTLGAGEEEIVARQLRAVLAAHCA
jgi:L-seryl-tRNA(Ser) seleniumtransferase